MTSSSTSAAPGVRPAVASPWRPHRPVRQLAQLYIGLTLYGVSAALMLRSNLGLNPWSVLHEGLAQRSGWSYGTVTIIVAVCVLLLWVPLRQRPGIGTVSDVVVIGLAADATLALLSEPQSLSGRAGLLISGILLNGVSSACYIGAGLGPGPRDGLMTGWVRRYGGSLRAVRTALEVAILTLGWILGGTVGLGTVLYSLSIGPLIHRFLPLLSVGSPPHGRGEQHLEGIPTGEAVVGPEVSPDRLPSVNDPAPMEVVGMRPATVRSGRQERP